MRIMLLGAGHVGQALVEALHEEHDVTVIDVDQQRLAALSSRYDVRAVEGDGTTKQVVRRAGVEDADLFIGCSSREEANLVCAMLVKRLSRAQTIIRTSSSAYLDAWRERELDIDFMVSPELETANAIAALLGLPAARHTDVFAEGKVQLVEFDVPPDVPPGALIGCALREAEIPEQSKVVGLIRGDRMIVPSGDAQILPGDRVVVIAAPDSARTWCRVAAEGAEQIDDVVIFGAGRMGTTIARVLLDRDLRVRLVDAQRDRVKEAEETLPGVRAFHAHAFDAANMLFDAIEKVAFEENGTLYIPRTALRDAIFATEGYEGITGTLTCDENGDCADPEIAVTQVENGEFNPIYTYQPEE